MTPIAQIMAVKLAKTTPKVDTFPVKPSSLTTKTPRKPSNRPAALTVDILSPNNSQPVTFQLFCRFFGLVRWKMFTSKVQNNYTLIEILNFIVEALKKCKDCQCFIFIYRWKHWC